MDADERELFEKTLREVAAERTGEDLDAALEELGWLDALSVEPQAAVSALFEAQGAANTTSSALDHVILSALDLGTGAGVGTAGGTAAGGVVLPLLGQWQPPGEVRDGDLSVRGLGTAAVARSDTAVVVARAGQADELAVATVDTADLVLRPVRGVDPELGLVEVVGDGVASTARSDIAPVAWADAVAGGQRALAHELVGVSRTMLRLAREHALDRIQFGRPIASFQAVRHRLADTLVAIEAADAAVGAAWDDGTPLTAALAKAVAGRSARIAARHCQQVLAGIGFTVEHPLHRYLKRALVLDRLLGDARSLTHRIGDDLLRSRELPSLLPL